MACAEAEELDSEGNRVLIASLTYFERRCLLYLMVTISN